MVSKTISVIGRVGAQFDAAYFSHDQRYLSFGAVWSNSRAFWNASICPTNAFSGCINAFWLTVLNMDKFQTRGSKFSGIKN